MRMVGERSGFPSQMIQIRKTHHSRHSDCHAEKTPGRCCRLFRLDQRSIATFVQQRRRYSE